MGSSPPREHDDAPLLRWLSDVLPWRVRIVHVVVVVAILAILARLLLLGDRVAHWDEARVAYWIDYYANSGSFAYRRIIHGPFIQHVNRWLFAIAGGSDFLMRLPVALIGGLLPLAALLFRKHLRGYEVVGLSLFLGANAVLLYYSRFMRSDVLVAAFMFVALGLLVRLYDTRKPRYLYGVSIFVALGFASKENAIIYLLTWVGGTALLADYTLYRPRSGETGLTVLRRSWFGRQGGRVRTAIARLSDHIARRRDPERSGPRVSQTLRTLWGRLRRGIRTPASLTRRVLRWGGHTVGAVIVFLGLIVFMYGARGDGLPGLEYPPPSPGEGWLGLWEAVGQPATLPGYVGDTLGRTYSEFLAWFGHTSDPGCNKDNIIDGYLCYLGQYVEVLVFVAGALVALALLGFLWERYGRTRSRNLVMFASYIGIVSVLGYPLGTDVFGAWIVVHAVVIMAIPAAVGLGLIYNWGREAAVNRDTIGAGLAALILVLAGLQVGVVAADSVYVNDQTDDNVLVQYAQPSGDPRPSLETMGQIAASDRSGPDIVVYYGETGEQYNDQRALVKHRDDWNISGTLDFRPHCVSWFNLLPVPWYFANSDADVDCSRSSADLTDRLGTSPPPMILSLERDTTVPDEALQNSYVPHTYDMRAPNYEMTFWIHEDWTSQ